MDKAKEILKFQALLQMAASSGNDLGEEMRFQQGVLRSLELTDGDINNLIHDRHAREGISPARGAIALAAVRQAGGLPYYGIRRAQQERPRPQAKTRKELAAEYLRARGKDPNLAPPAASIPIATTPVKVASDELLVPYGVDPDANIVHARDASPGVVYSCSCCETVLVLHAGQIKARHFAHKANTACDSETLAHITAKLLIAKVIREHHHAIGPGIRLECTCGECHAAFEKLLPADVFTASRVEVPVGRFICDVVAFKEDAAVLAVEVFKSHAVDSDKAGALKLPWIELRADQVLEDPLRWRPVQAHLKPTICPQCKAKRAKLETVRERWKLPAAHPNYVAAVASCWKCHEEIIWYWWPGVPFAESRPPASIPPIVQYRYSKMYGGRYWMNVCPGCNASQGDNFVFLASDSPFKGLPVNDTNSMKEHRERHNAGVVEQFIAIVRRNV